jgi:hypothetical protein
LCEIMTETHTGLGSESQNRACTSAANRAGKTNGAEWSCQGSAQQRVSLTTHAATRGACRRWQQSALDRRRASREDRVARLAGGQVRTSWGAWIAKLTACGAGGPGVGRRGVGQKTLGFFEKHSPNYDFIVVPPFCHHAT